jgi:hypothetical protein
LLFPSQYRFSSNFLTVAAWRVSTMGQKFHAATARGRAKKEKGKKEEEKGGD